MLLEGIITCVAALIFSISTVCILEIIINAYNDGMKLISEEEKSIEQ